MSKIKMKKSLAVEGIVRVEDGRVIFEVEEFGDKDLAELMLVFDGDLVKATFNVVEDVME